MGKKVIKPSPTNTPEPPKLARRGANRRSVLKTGRTLSAKRERLETSNERVATHQKIKRKERTRLVATIVGFLFITIIVIGIGILLSKINNNGSNSTDGEITPTVIYKPTIEIIDENTGGTITSRMSQYIGQAESDFREYNLIPIKAVIPSGAIREVDFYFDSRPGYIKTTMDRDTAVSAEDAFRMVRYLENQGITEYQYIDVRLPGKAYWK